MCRMVQVERGRGGAWGDDWVEITVMSACPVIAGILHVFFTCCNWTSPNFRTSLVRGTLLQSVSLLSQTHTMRLLLEHAGVTNGFCTGNQSVPAIPSQHQVKAGCIQYIDFSTSSMHIVYIVHHGLLVYIPLHNVQYCSQPLWRGCGLRCGPTSLASWMPRWDGMLELPAMAKWSSLRWTLSVRAPYGQRRTTSTRPVLVQHYFVVI